MTLDLQKKVSMCFDRKDCQESTQERGSVARIPQGPSLIPWAFGTSPPPPRSHSSMILGKTGVYYHVFYLTDSQQVTDALLVPPLVLFLVNNPLVHKFTLSSLKHVFSGAAPLAKKLEENVKKRIASIEAVRQGWNTKPKLACEYSCLSFLLATLR